MESPSFKRVVIQDINPLSGVKKTRVLHVPNQALKEKQRTLMRSLMRIIKTSEFAKNIAKFVTGCFPGCSPLKNVYAHKPNAFFYIIDIKDAYSYVDIEKMTNILFLMFKTKEKQEIKDFLKKYCFADGGLMTGSCVSPLLFNIYCYYTIDVFVEKILEDHSDIVYTRYLDDLCFSSKKPFSRRLRRKIREIIYEAGFQINHRKTVLLSLEKGPVSVNGIGIRQDWSLFLPRRILKKIRGLIHLSLSRRARGLWKKVEGYMALFKHITKSRPKTKTEKKLLKFYYETKPIFSTFS